jgi:hypothetical protein
MNTDQPIPLNAEDAAEVRRMIAAGQTVPAIKRLREITGCGLAAAKAWVDQELATSEIRPARAASTRSAVPLSEEVQRRVEIMFEGKDRRTAADLLTDECGSNLPFLENLTSPQLDRYRFAALKISCGRLDLLRQAVEIARTDWRDLLVAAGFGNDPQVHERWMPE